MARISNFLAALAGASALVAAGASSAAQITLGPSNVIGWSGAYDASFGGDNILDQQTGDVADVFASTYWIYSDGNFAPALVTIDLGADYRLDAFELFNTHNDAYNDRGTGAFTIVGGNAVTAYAGGFKLSGAETLLVSGALTNDTVNPIVGQTFASLSSAGFRYLEFRPTSVLALNPYSPTSYGLNELRVYGGEPSVGGVPEPATWAMMILGFGAAGAVIRGRRRVAAA